MPLLFAIPISLVGYALFAGAIANKPDPSPAPVIGGSAFSFSNLAFYAAAGAGVYYVAKKVIK